MNHLLPIPNKQNKRPQAQPNASLNQAVGLLPKETRPLLTPRHTPHIQPLLHYRRKPPILSDKSHIPGRRPIPTSAALHGGHHHLAVVVGGWDHDRRQAVQTDRADNLGGLVGGDGRDVAKLPLDGLVSGGDQAANLGQDKRVALGVGIFVPDEEDGDLSYLFMLKIW